MFEPYDSIRIVTDDDSKNIYNDSEITQDGDPNDDNYYHSSDLFDRSDKAENTNKELSSLGFPQVNHLLVLYIFHKVTKIIMNVISKQRHKYSRHSHPKKVVWQQGTFCWLHLLSCQGVLSNELVK